MADVLSDVNSKIIGTITNVNWSATIGWIIFILIAIGGGFWVYVYYRNKKLYNEKITAKERIAGEWIPTIFDNASVVKMGKSGFLVLKLKKRKEYKLAFRKIGKRDYMFYILPDGYWYNGYEGGDLLYMDKTKGYTPVLATHPSMRAQYTALETQIESMHGQQQGFWDKYGTWVLGIAFVLIAGVMLWLNYKEFASASGNFAGIAEKLSSVADKLDSALASASSTGTNGLIPVR